MRFNHDFPPDTHQPVPIDRAVTLLMPAGFDDQLLSDLSAKDSSDAASRVREPDRGPGFGTRVLAFLRRPN